MKAVEGWTSGELGELCSIEIGGTPSRSNPDFWDTSKETSNRWVSIRDLNRIVIVDTAEHISDSGVKHSNAKLQNPGTVLLSFKLSIGRVAFAGIPLYTNEAIAGLNSKKMGPNYLFHGLHQWDLLQGVDQAIKGATLNKAKLKKIKFQYPAELSEQSKIAEILSTVDRAIEQTEALIAKQQRIKTGLMQDLLTRGIDEHGNLRSEKTHKFKDSSLGRIPVEWEIKKLDDLLIKKQYGISTSLSDEPIGIPVLRMNNLVNGEVDFTDLKYSERKDAKNLILGDDDVLFNRTNSIDYVGRTGIYRHHGRPVSFASYLVRLIPDSVKLHPEYLNLWLNDGANQIRVKQFATIGVQQANVNPTNLGTLSIALPKAIIEQEQIVEAISIAANYIRCIDANLHKVRSLKTALMQDLLTGRKRVTALLNDMGIVS